MKKLSMILLLLLSMTMGSYRVFAQSVTVTLIPGYNWISIPSTDTLDFATALGSFTPAEGDVIKSQWSNAVYRNGHWVGQISQFYPGYGYMYYSKRTMPVLLTFNAQQPAPQVIVTTTDPTDITAISATCGGNVASDAGNYVSVQKGICWSLNPNPTFNDNHIEAGDGNGNFTLSMTELSMNTTYYVRAYAVTDAGTVFGEEKTFTTKNGIPMLTTASVTDIGRYEATCGGTIIDDGGLTITERGVCWSTSPNPTIMDNYVVSGMGIGDFVSSMTGLTISTTYYVRSYATNAASTTYGNEMEFTTQQTWQNGVSPGVFSVSASQQVYFSQGNLQYIGSATTPYWKFADNQWDCLGTTTGQNSSDENVDRDLFGWGTSGWNNGNTYYHPWDTDNSNGSLYGPPGTYDLTGSYVNADWGVYNQISNGGNDINMWRTLTINEWRYVFNSRSTSSGIRYAKAQVNGVNGVILLPDDWSSTVYNLNNTNNGSASYDSNTISFNQWSILENAGAVFLPTAGYRDGTTVSYLDSIGEYWSASYATIGYYQQSACCVYITNNYFGMLGDTSGGVPNRRSGYSVRLVRNAE